MKLPENIKKHTVKIKGVGCTIVNNILSVTLWSCLDYNFVFWVDRHMHPQARSSRLQTSFCDIDCGRSVNGMENFNN